MSAKVKLALVGCGVISGHHINGYRDLRERGCESFEVTACMDPNESNANQRADEIAEFQGNRPAVLGSIKDISFHFGSRLLICFSQLTLLYRRED